MEYQLKIDVEKYEEVLYNLTSDGWNVIFKSNEKAVLKKKDDKYFVYASNA